MSTLSFRPQGGNLNPEDDSHGGYIARRSGHPDESNSFEDDHQLHRQMLAQLEHEQAVDLGDDAVNADATSAEARVRQAFPKQSTVTFVREQVRTISTTAGAEFQVRWRVFLADLRSGKGQTLEEAIEALVAKATPADAAIINKPA